MARRPHGVQVLADIHVKHAELLETRSLAESARLAAAAGADAVLVTGTRTGEPPRIEDLRAAHAGGKVYIGSGLTPENAVDLAAHADGAVVGTSMMTAGRVAPERVATMVEAWRRAKR